MLRTARDMLKLVPFVVIVVTPGGALLLPLLLKLNFLPSRFQQYVFFIERTASSEKAVW